MAISTALFEKQKDSCRQPAYVEGPEDFSRYMTLHLNRRTHRSKSVSNKSDPEFFLMQFKHKEGIVISPLGVTKLNFLSNYKRIVQIPRFQTSARVVSVEDLQIMISWIESAIEDDCFMFIFIKWPLKWRLRGTANERDIGIASYG